MRRLLLLALLSSARILAAQAPDSCAGVFSTGETRLDSLFVSVETGIRMPKVPAPGLHAFAESVGSSLELPRPFALPGVVDFTFPERHEHGDSAVEPRRYREGLMGEVMVELDRTGALKRVMLTQTTLTPAIDAALVNAVRSAASLPLSDELRRALGKARGGALFVRLRTVGGSISGSGESFAAVAVAALPVPVVTLTAQPVRKKGALPIYPEVAQANSIDGKVNLVFVIGRDGKVIPGTVNLFGTTQREFAKASIDALMRAQFAPAMVGSCPVAALASMPFTFTMGR